MRWTVGMLGGLIMALGSAFFLGGIWERLHETGALGKSMFCAVLVLTVFSLANAIIAATVQELKRDKQDDGLQLHP